MEGGIDSIEHIPLGAIGATVAALLLTLLLAVILTRRDPSLPPGPRGWPLLGSLPSLGANPHVYFAKLSCKYGPLMLVHLGSTPALVVTSSDMAREVLKTHDHVMASRPLTMVSKIISYNGSDVALAPLDHHWRSKRKLCVQELLTSARINRCQPTRRREALSIVYEIMEKFKRGEAVNTRELFSNMALNNLSQMMLNKSYYGRTANSNAAEQALFRQTLRNINDISGAFVISDYIPMLGPFDLHGYHICKRANDAFKKLDSYFEEVIEEHNQRKTLPGSEDFVDSMLALSKEGKEFQETLTNEAIKGIMLDILFAGADTSATVMEWLLAEVMNSPGVMKRVQEELDSVVGPNRLVEEDDLPNLEYFQAVVKETFRLHPPAPMLVPHESTEDCQVAGYHVPGRSRVLVNVWAIQRDPAVWDKPLEFNPDRFLTSKVDVKGTDYELLPFGSGRRVCPGMNLGLLKVQYPLALLLHAFSWSPAGQEVMDMSEAFGIVIYKAIALSAMARPRVPTRVLEDAVAA